MSSPDCAQDVLTVSISLCAMRLPIAAVQSSLHAREKGRDGEGRKAWRKPQSAKPESFENVRRQKLQFNCTSKSRRAHITSKSVKSVHII